MDGMNGWMDGWMERKLKFMSLRSTKYALKCKLYLSYFIKAITSNNNAIPIKFTFQSLSVFNCWPEGLII